MKLITKICCLILVVLFVGCSQDDLNIKPDQSILVPTTLDDFQSLLDNSSLVMNKEPGIVSIVDDDFISSDAGYIAFNTNVERNAYTFQPEIYEGLNISDWGIPYTQIFYANIVLDGWKNLTQNEQESIRGKQIKGEALFYRAWAFYELATVFAAPYQEVQASKLPGIPLKLSSDINIHPSRGSLMDTWMQIEKDGIDALNLLPEKTSLVTRPSKVAANAFLAKFYLQMGKYDLALSYANAALIGQPDLLDYNTLNPASARPFPREVPGYNNPEVIFYSELLGYSYLRSTEVTVTPELYQQYAINDLRKSLFFKANNTGSYNFRGSYSGVSSLVGGLSTDEMYLIKAECLARTGDKDKAMDTLNFLLQKRWKSGTFVPLNASTETGALSIILGERRKELVARGERYRDLKRLNLEPSRKVNIERVIQGIHYILPANDPKYVFPIPDQEILLTGIAQNPR